MVVIRRTKELNVMAKLHKHLLQNVNAVLEFELSKVIFDVSNNTKLYFVGTLFKVSRVREKCGNQI